MNKEVPSKQKYSAINVCSLNIRSLTIKEDSVKLKRLFKLDASVIVLTEVCVDGPDFNKLHQYWREQVSKYHIWTTGSKYRGIMILIKKNSGCYYENLVPINDDAILLDNVFPGGITVNTACVYGQVTKIMRTSGTWLRAILI